MNQELISYEARIITKHAKITRMRTLVGVTQRTRCDVSNRALQQSGYGVARRSFVADAAGFPDATGDELRDSEVRYHGTQPVVKENVALEVAVHDPDRRVVVHVGHSLGNVAHDGHDIRPKSRPPPPSLSPCGW
jgi:hypothetical protein